MDNPHNIAIQLTPAGAAAIAVIRLRGPRVAALLTNHFSKPPSLGRCVHGQIRDGDRVIDDAVVVLCEPTTADVNVHGGPWVVRNVLDLASRHGFEILEPAVPLVPETVDGKTELRQEILQYLPLARTELGVRVLLAQEEAWESLIERADKNAITSDEVHRILADQTITHLLYPPSVAIVGAANVGKSTLANQLFGQRRSITADLPGTTRDWVGEIANIDGLPVMLLDTPGQRDTQDAIEHAAIQRAGDQIAKSRLLILMLDSSRTFGGEQARLLTRYPAALKVMNKIDSPTAAGMPPLDAIRTISTTGQGMDELRARILSFFYGEIPLVIARPRCWTARQREFLSPFVLKPLGMRKPGDSSQA